MYRKIIIKAFIRMHKVKDKRIKHIDLLNWLKKEYFKKLLFQEISKEFIKNNFELMISIYLFTNNYFQ